jgi:CheY-like chemotaxis protein
MKILLADDSMTAQNMGKKILTDAGYEVVAVSNGAAAVKKIAEQRPDVAVLDVYMPGYTGLEVCERLKSAHDTTNMPVLLTVGRMEPFKPEEGNRVKADGIIIKPFEASDLLAAIQKLEQRLGPARAVIAAIPSDEDVPIHEKTQKIQIPYLEDFKAPGPEEWKISSRGQAHQGEHRTVAPAPAFSVPEAMQGVPAMGLDELEVVVPSEAGDERNLPSVDPVPQALPSAKVSPPREPASATPTLAPLPGASKNASGVWKALDKAREWFGGSTEPQASTKNEQVAFLPVTGLPDEKAVEVFPTSASNPPDSAVKDRLLEHTSAAPVEAAPVRDPNLEMSPAAELTDMEVVVDPDLEPTIRTNERSEDSVVATDPALVTDSSELGNAFPTRFGVTNAGDTPIGIASNFPELYASAAPAAGPTTASKPSGPLIPESQTPAKISFEKTAPQTPPKPAPKFPSDGPAHAAMKSSWVAEQTALEKHESNVRLANQMPQISKAGAVPAEEEVSEIELIEPEAEAAEQASRDIGTAADPQLAAAMAAAVGAEITPSVTQAASQAAISSAHGDEDKHAELISDIFDRVTEEMKPELIRRITAELRKKK